MLDYSYYTNDSTYDGAIATALIANVGPAYDFMVPEHWLDEGNDDQAFWAFAALSAAEHGFEQPASATSSGVPSWTAISINVWESMVDRWNTTHCGGGLSWQIFAENFNGLNYKNSASNGAFFHISARLALLTGNTTYLDWATKVWDWTAAVGLIDDDYNVFDGTDSAENCTTVNPLSFSYQNGIFLQGAAALANLTGSAVWAGRATSLLDASRAFFNPSDNATNIMWEHACEGVGRCTTDMKSFKGYLSRFMYASSVVMPSLASNISTYMRKSAVAAGESCTGISTGSAPSANGTTCGQRWYVGGFDENVGLGQELSALETVHGLLVLDGVVNDVPTPTPSTTATTTPTPSPTASQQSGAHIMAPADLRWTVLGMACALFAYGMA